MNTVGELVKELSEYGVNTLDYALKSLAGEDYERLREVLEATKKDLGAKVTSPQSESKTKSLKATKQPSATVVFKDYVVPEMLAGLTKYEMNEDKWTKITVNLHFKRNYSTLSEFEKIKVHAEMMRQEENSEAVLLFIKRERGLLYWCCYKDRKKDEDVQAWFKNTLGVVYQRARECMNFAGLTSLYPRLLICGLRWTQFLKHNKRLLNHINSKNNFELKERLKRSIAVEVQGTDCHVEEATEKDAIDHESRLQCSNFKYDADNHYNFPLEESHDEDELDGDDDDDELFRTLCDELEDVSFK